MRMSPPGCSSTKGVTSYTLPLMMAPAIVDRIVLGHLGLGEPLRLLSLLLPPVVDFKNKITTIEKIKKIT